MTKGSFNTGSYTSDGVKCSLVFSWERSSYSIADNTTTIYWELKGSVSPSNSWMMCGGFTVVIDGETVFSKSTDYRAKVFNGTVVASGTKTIKHNTDGSRNFSASASAGIWTYAVNKSGSGSWALDNIPRQATLTAAPNFNDEENPVITYSNPAGNAVESLKACIADTNGYYLFAEYRDIDKVGNTYTFTLTDAERNAIRNASVNSNELAVKFYITTVIGGITYYSILDKVVSIVNAMPTIAPTAIDRGSNSAYLTGDNDGIIIKGHNSISWAVNATAHKGASIKSYSVVCGGKSSTASSGVFGNVESGEIVFSATDSRGNTTTQILSRQLIDYIRLTCNLDASAPTTDGVMRFAVKGNFFNGSFGAINNVLTVQYRYKANSEDYGAWQPLTAAITDNSFMANGELSGLDYQSTYTIQARAIDKVFYGGVESVERKVKTTPVFDWGAEDFNFNVPVSINHEPIADWIVESGESSGWFYRKWSSGIAECWKIHYVNGVNAAAKNYSGFYYSDTITVDFPFTFANLPTVVVDGGSSSYMNFVRVFGKYADAASFVVVGLSNEANTNITVDIRAIGKWK